MKNTHTSLTQAEQAEMEVMMNKVFDLFFLLETSEKLPDERMEAMRKEWKNGGKDAFFSELLDMNLSDKSAR